MKENESNEIFRTDEKVITDSGGCIAAKLSKRGKFFIIIHSKDDTNYKSYRSEIPRKKV